MECTEGKLEENQTCINCIDLLSKEDGNIVAQIMECDEDELSVTQRANAKELVRRWNAFEKDGLVDKLLVACKEAQKAIFLLYECNKDVEIALGSAIQLKKAEKAIEAAIAKAKA